MQGRRSLNPQLLEPISEIERLACLRTHNQLNLMADPKHQEAPKKMKDYFMPNQYQPFFYVQAPQNQAV